MRKLIGLVLLFLGGTAAAEPNGYVLLSPTSIRKDLRHDKVVLLFDLPCYNNRSVELATLIASSDDSGDLAMTFGLAYPAGYCMDSLSDRRARPWRGYARTISARKYGITSGVTLKKLKVLPARRR